MRSTELTLEPLTRTASLATVKASVGCAPEFLDAVGVEKHFGIRRSLAFRLLTEHQIRGVSIRQKGRLRGKRLFDCASIREFLLANVDREVLAEAKS